MKNNKYYVLTTLLLGLVYLPGCSVDTINNDIKDYLGGNQAAIDQAQDLKTTIENKNPVFESEEEVIAKNAVAKNVDEFAQKALDKVFSDAKLISGGNTDVTPFILRYIVKRRIDQVDGDMLYQELINQGSRAKDGGSPNFFTDRSTVEMSIFKDVGGRSYIIAIVMDLGEQIIWVNVY